MRAWEGEANVMRGSVASLARACRARRRSERSGMMQDCPDRRQCSRSVSITSVTARRAAAAAGEAGGNKATALQVALRLCCRRRTANSCFLMPIERANASLCLVGAVAMAAD